MNLIARVRCAARNRREIGEFDCQRKQNTVLDISGSCSSCKIHLFAKADFGFDENLRPCLLITRPISRVSGLSPGSGSSLRDFGFAPLLLWIFEISNLKTTPCTRCSHLLARACPDYLRRRTSTRSGLILTVSSSVPSSSNNYDEIYTSQLEQVFSTDRRVNESSGICLYERIDSRCAIGIIQLQELSSISTMCKQLTPDFANIMKRCVNYNCRMFKALKMLYSQIR